MSEFSSKGHEQSDWKSPRKIEEEIRNYRRKKFEEYWQMTEIGLMTRLEMINTLKAGESPDDDCPTMAIDTGELKRLLDE